MSDIWIAYVNDEGPSLAAFHDRDDAKAYAKELDRIMYWRATRTVSDEEDEEVSRLSIPPDDYPGPERKYDWSGAVATFDLPILDGDDPIAQARKDASMWNSWGEYEP